MFQTTKKAEISPSKGASVSDGHSDISVTLNTYTHLKLDDAREEVEKLAKKQAEADAELRQLGMRED